MARTSGTLEFAILGLLHDAPMHGYELRKRLAAELGTFRAFSYGSLYPALKTLVADGLITQDDADGISSSRRSKIVYRLTADGKERFQSLVSEAGPSAWEDDSFSVHLAFFGRTDADVRLRILEGRRSRLEERVDALRTSLRQAGKRVDSYTLALQEHGLDSVEREVRWLNELIKTEREGTAEPDLASRTTSTIERDAAGTPVVAHTNTTKREDTGSRARSSRQQDAPASAHKE